MGRCAHCGRSMRRHPASCPACGGADAKQPLIARASGPGRARPKARGDDAALRGLALRWLVAVMLPVLAIGAVFAFGKPTFTMAAAMAKLGFWVVLPCVLTGLGLAFVQRAVRARR